MINAIKLALHMLVRWWVMRQRCHLLSEEQVKSLRDKLPDIDESISENVKDEMKDLRGGYVALAGMHVEAANELRRRRRNILERLASDERLRERIEMYV